MPVPNSAEPELIIRGVRTLYRTLLYRTLYRILQAGPAASGM